MPPTSTLDLEIAVADHIRELLSDGLGEFGDRLAKLVVLDHHGIDDQVGLEPDLVERLQVGRIGHGDEQAVAPLVQRQHAAAGRQLRVDQLLVDLLDVEAVEVHDRGAERARCEHRDLRRGHPLRQQHLLDEADLGCLGLALEKFGVVFRKQAVLHHGSAEPADGS